MQNNKNSAGEAPESLSPDEQHRIEVRIDKMLNPELPDSKPPESPKEPTPPPIDIFSDPKTAPEVPEEVMKTMVELDPEKTAATKSGKVIESKDAPEPAAAAEPPETTPDSSLDDAKIDIAVDDITAHESDEILAAQDAEVARAFDPKKLTLRQKLKNFFIRWWDNKKARYGTLAGLVILIVVLAVVPVTRSFALNLANTSDGVA